MIWVNFLFISSLFNGYENVPLKQYFDSEKRIYQSYVIIITALSGSEASGKLALKKHFFSKVNHAKKGVSATTSLSDERQPQMSPLPINMP